MDHVCHLCFMFALSCLFLAPLWLPDGKGLASLLSRVFLMCFFFHFPIWCLGSGVVLHCIDSWPLPSSLFLMDMQCCTKKHD